MSAVTEVTLRWIRGETFEIVDPENANRLLDGKRNDGLSPMESLLASLTGCMGIDVATILLKMRKPLRAMEVRTLGHRREEPPRYFRKIELDFRFRGEFNEKDANRAIDLSFDKYCSVFHSLRPDLVIERRLSWEE